MSRSDEVIIEYDDVGPRPKEPEHREDGIAVPFERINPDTLRNLIGEFVTREWEEIGDASCDLEGKIEQVYRQLRDKRAKVVFDLASNSCNIVVNR